MSKPRRTTFRIATREGTEDTTGYVLGLFATRKERYFWEFTHIPTGVKLTTYPCHETKDSALAHLAKLDREGLNERDATTLARFPLLP